MKRAIVSALTLTAVGVGGWVSGSRYDISNKSSGSVPGCGQHATLLVPLVRAAIPMTRPDPDPPTPGNRGSEIMRFGFPSLDQLQALDDYVLSYDRRNRTANWVFEHLTRENLKQNDQVDRTKCVFREDNAVHPLFRAANEDYKGSGYDRGHLAAAGNHRISQKQCDQTFVLSNMAPQVGRGFNRDAWNKLEKYVRHLTKFYINVYVCTGPLYLPRKEQDGKTYVKYEVIGKNQVAVPTHFYKVIVAETKDNELEMEAYVMPNAVIDDKTSLAAFQVPVEKIEKAAGLLFYDKIPRNKFKRINGGKLSFV